MKTREFDKNWRELREIKDFLSRFGRLVQQEKEESVRRFVEGLLKLNERLKVIEVQEESPKLEQFRSGMVRLVSARKEARQKRSWHKAHFNVFKVLGCEYDERIHSNLLAWLLNPEEAHGLKDKFLHSFVRNIFSKEIAAQGTLFITREPRESEGIPDIVIESEDWQLVIENKIRSPEREDQTKRYAKPYEAAGGVDERFFLVFLTPHGDKPQSESFHAVSYGTVVELLQRLLSQAKGDASVLLKHFVEHIRGHIQ
jgi:hypothetical protein